MSKEVVRSDYSISGIKLRIEGERLVRAVKAMRAFAVFACEDDLEADVRIIEDETLRTPQGGEMLYRNESDGAVSEFWSFEGGHFFRMKRERLCTEQDSFCLGMGSPEVDVLLLTVTEDGVARINGSFMPQILRFALWIGFGINVLGRRRIAVHSSCVVCEGKAFLFLGESGTGKSTHTRLWLENIPGSVLLNDDSPIISAEGDTVMVHGSPWSGKTPCYKQETYPLGGCVRLSQAPYNKIRRLPVLNAIAALHPSCPPDFAQDNLYDEIEITLDRLLSSVPVWHLECLPDADAARLSHDTVLGLSEI